MLSIKGDDDWVVSSTEEWFEDADEDEDADAADEEDEGG